MQIKIRAWDSINKKMLSWEDLLSGREFRPKMREPEKYGLELMLYTGLKDKNGREIYEGDVLKGMCYFSGAGWYDTGEGDYPIHDEVKCLNGEFMCRRFDLHRLNSTTSVIGNIYENPKMVGGR